MGSEDGRPRDPMALLNDKMDTIIDLMRYGLGFEPIYMQDFDMARSPVALHEMTNMIQELCLASVMPSAPDYTDEFTVGNVQVILAQNDSRPLARVEVTNDDLAQPLWVSQRGVLVTTGRVILAQDTVPFVLPQGEFLSGICVIPAISVRVSYGYDFFKILDSLRTRQREAKMSWTGA